jgi:pimeloyl-ACP methyl ester carboxylesterase
MFIGRYDRAQEVLMKSIVMLCVLCLGSICAAQQAAPTTAPAPGKSTYVIVHGAWGGGWAFREVDAMLTADGNKVFRPTLTGQGERVHLSSPDVGLSTHINDIVNVIEYEDLHDVILVGHSYGGMVITGVADRVPDRIKHIIYLDALLPENGESLNDVFAKAGQPSTRPIVDGYIIPTWVKPDQKPPHDVPISAKCFSEPITLKQQDAARKIPTTYILTVDPGKQPQDDHFYVCYQRAEARGWKTMTMEGDHNVQWSKPKELVKLLENE